jgi:ubiquinone/menaquinone biosynthesis C-methylase UbiE
VADAISRFAGFAAEYDAVRPALPADLIAFLTSWSGQPRPDVVDIGAGTGLSTMIWAGTARQVIAVEPGAEMRAVLTRKIGDMPPGPTRFAVTAGTAEQTGLTSESADIVTASTAMHWFDLSRALPEIGRVLRPGGVFAAAAPVWPPHIDPEVDAAFEVFDATMTRLEIERGLHPPDAGRDHTASLRRSGVFRYVSEIALHTTEECDSARLLGLARSRGGTAALLAAGASEDEIGLTALTEKATRGLPAARPGWLTFLVSLAVRD